MSKFGMVEVAEDVNTKMFILHQPAYCHGSIQAPGMEIEHITAIILLEPAKTIGCPVRMGKSCGRVKLLGCDHTLGRKEKGISLRFQQPNSPRLCTIQQTQDPLLDVVGAAPNAAGCVDSVRLEIADRPHNGIFKQEMRTDVVRLRRRSGMVGVGMLHAERGKDVLSDEIVPGHA